MMNNNILSTYTPHTISVVEFGAIDHLSSLLESVGVSSPLTIVDSRLHHLSHTYLLGSPFVLDVNQSQNLLMQEIERQIKVVQADSIILLSDHQGLDIVKLFLSTYTTTPLSFIAIPTSYTTRTLNRVLPVYNSEEKRVIYYKAQQPKMVIIDERAVKNMSAKEKALSVVAIFAGFLDILHHTPYASLAYFLAKRGLMICKEYGYKASHSPHDSESRHQILFASHLLSIITHEMQRGVLEVMAITLHAQSGAPYPLVMSILLSTMSEVIISGNKEVFKKIADILEAPSMKDAIHTFTTTLLEPIHPPIESCLYDIVDGESHERLITLEHMMVASNLTFRDIDVSIHPSIITEDTIIRYFEAAFWGYNLPKEWI